VLCFARGDLPAARQEWNGVRVCRLDALRAALAPDPAYAPLPPEARRRIGDCLARLVGGAWCD